MERSARQQVEAWQRETQGTLWSGYDDEDVDLDDAEESFPRRTARPRRRRNRGRRRG